MRALKFRAWDKVSKKFLHPWPHGFSILGETTCFDLIGMQLKERNPEKTTLDMLNDVVLMQFTGLLDKNEREIWEGDSILLNGLKCTIVWNEDRAGFYYDTGYSKHQHQWPLTCDEAIECEVIGNIYEAE
jgi:uncharacterized phage protein (TIGR01671 family)